MIRNFFFPRSKKQCKIDLNVQEESQSKAMMGREIAKNGESSGRNPQSFPWSPERVQICPRKKRCRDMLLTDLIASSITTEGYFLPRK